MTSSPRQYTEEEKAFLQKRQPGESHKQHLGRLIAASTPFSLTPEENLQVLKELNEGMEDFLLNEKKISAATQQEFKTLHIGGYNPI